MSPHFRLKPRLAGVCRVGVPPTRARVKRARARWWKGGKTGLLPDVALRVFAHASSAEKHFIEMTERSFHRGFPLAVWMLADGGPFYN